MPNLSILNFNNSPVKLLVQDNKYFFNLIDVCDIFGIQNPRRVMSEMLDVKGVHQAYTLAKDNKKRKLAFISEHNLYRIIFRSDKPIAVDFQNWVFDEVLPTIRKTGSYSLTINTEQKYQIKKAVNERVYRTGEHHQTIYHKLYDQFKINSYEALPAPKFEEAIDFLGGINVRNGLSDDDWYKLARLFVIADRMHNRICDITPALEAIFSKYADSFHSMAFHFKRELNEAKSIIERETAHIQAKGIMDDWNRVLPVIRY